MTLSDGPKMLPIGVKPFQSLIFGGTDLNSEIPRHIIVAETSPPIGRALPTTILYIETTLIAQARVNGSCK